MDDQAQPPPPSNSKEHDDPTPEDDDDPSSTVLDLTSFQLHNLDSVELPPSLTELDLTANRLSSLDTRIGTLSNLIKLSFRQNLIADAAVEPISGWDALSGLEVLNQIEHLQNWIHFLFVLFLEINSEYEFLCRSWCWGIIS